MAREPKEMELVLFPNDKKGNTKAPDMKGFGMVAGVVYDVAAWDEVSKANKPYMKIKLSPPYQRQDQPYQPTPSPVHNQVVAAAASRPASARPAPAPQQEQDEISF
jgi:hypothetical protein